MLPTGCSRQPDHKPTLSEGRPLFREAAAESGLNFRHFNGATGDFFMPEIMGSGVALIDYDGDGDLDVYLVQGCLLDSRKTLADALFPLPSGQKLGNRLFRNELIPSGRLQFTDVTEQAHVGYVGYGMGVAVGDYDNDGFPDLYVTNFGHNVLYHNNGDGTFTDVTRAAGADDPRWSTSAAFLDYDRDGYLDLFITNYVNFTVKGNVACQAPTGERDYCTPASYAPAASRLLHNLRNGRFADVTDASGIGSAVGPGLGVVAADLNGDGWPDIFVSNDGAANRLWINQRDGTFKEVALTAGLAYGADGMARAGMGIAAGDFDNDGDDDVLVTNLAGEGALLFQNDGGGSFEDVTLQHGLGTMTAPFTGFGVDWFDYDKDGRLDLFIANGAVTIREALRGERYPYHQPNQLFRNQGRGQRFLDVSQQAGSALALSEVSRGAAFGDIDNDGDIDIVVSNNNGPVRLLLNQADSRNHWLGVRLQGTKANRQGIGARMQILRPGAELLTRRVHTDSSYLSASDVRAHFGLGELGGPQTVVVAWPDGSKERWDNINADTTITLRQGSGKQTQ